MNSEEILVEYHHKHPNRLHQFFHREIEGFAHCIICGVNLRVLNQEAQIVEDSPKRLQWNAETKHALLQALGSKCVWCGETREEALEIDHFIPLSWCGSNDLSNLQILCSNCHRERHRGSTKDFVVCNDFEVEPAETLSELKAGQRRIYLPYPMLKLLVQLMWKYRGKTYKDIAIISQNEVVVAIEDPITQEQLTEPISDLYTPPTGPCMPLKALAK